MKKVLALLAVGAMLAVGTSTAWAFGCHRSCASSCDYGSGCGVVGSDCGSGYGGYGAADCGCGSAVQYRTEYRDVKRTVYKQVPVTKEEEVSETVSVPVTREENRECTVMVPVTKEIVQQRQVCKYEYRNEEREVTEFVQQSKPVVEKYNVCVPETHIEKRTATVQVPVMAQEVRHQTFTVMHSVPEVVTHQVVCCHRVPTYDCCGCVCGCQTVQEVHDVSCTVYRCVPETQTRDFTVNVCHYESKQETYDVPVTTTRIEERSRTYNQIVCVPTTRKVAVQVCVPTTVTENYKVQVCEMEARKESYKVQVCEYKQEVRKHKVQVTTYKTVAEEVTEKVAYQVAVPAPVVVAAPCAVASAPCATYAPASYSGCGSASYSGCCGTASYESNCCNVGHGCCRHHRSHGGCGCD